MMTSTSFVKEDRNLVVHTYTVKSRKLEVLGTRDFIRSIEICFVCVKETSQRDASFTHTKTNVCIDTI